MGGGNRGGQKRGRTQRRHFRDGRDNVWKKPRPDEGSDTAAAGWAPFVTESPMFEQYYKKQGIVPEDEWDEFFASLRKPLPAVFRINASGQFAMAIRDQIQHDFIESSKDDIEIDGDAVELVKPLSWYPDKLAWHLNFSRMQLRKNQTLVRIHEFLKQENEIGSITRQEAVSMLPPLFLDVKPHHRVLDMCAAPGSKTFQLLEMIHSADKKGSLPEGLVIANDLDVQRCHLLIHQTKRMCSPNVMVTNHEAQHFPGLRKERNCAYAFTSSPSACSAEKALEPNSDPDYDDATIIEEDRKELIFDRVLCDVPCSGDGTIRKAPDIWKKWNAGIANGLHRLQVQIAMRGVALLKVGGRLVYSTCSLNPVEDEAVVGEILRRSKGCMVILDVSNELPQLKRRPGLKTWKVRDKGQWISSYHQVNKHRAGAVVPGMFPSGKGPEDNLQPEDTNISLDGCDQLASRGAFVKEGIKDGAQSGKIEEEAHEGEEEIAILPLEHCMRILPHDQDTGGFFVAVFQKISPLKVEHLTKEPQRKHIHSVAVEPEVTVASGVCSHTRKDACEMSETIMSDSLLQSGSPDPKSDLVHGEDSAMKILEKVVEAKGETCISGAICLESNQARMTVDNHTEENQQKIGEAKVEADNCGKIDEGLNQKSIGSAQRQGNWKGVDPVLFLRDDAIIDSLVNFYGIKETFPLRGHLVTRSEDTSRLKRIYYVSQSVANVMKLNFRAGEQLKITSVGLKIFERQGGKVGFSPCAFRIASEGLPVLLPHLTKQIVHASKLDFKLLLSSKAVPFTAFKDASFATAVQALLPGCCIVALNDTSDLEFPTDASLLTAIGCWRGRTNMSLLIPKVEAGQLLERLSLAEGDELQSLKARDGEALNEPKSLETLMEDVGNTALNNFEDDTGVIDEIDKSELLKKSIVGADEPESLEDSNMITDMQQNGKNVS